MRKPLADCVWCSPFGYSETKDEDSPWLLIDKRVERFALKMKLNVKLTIASKQILNRA